MEVSVIPKRLFSIVLPSLLCMAVASTSAAEGTGDFVPLFDGKTTEGWIKPFDWGEAWVKDGTIHLKGDKKFFLVTEKTYKNFELEAEVFCPEGGNSGIQFRCHYEPNKLWGYQAEVDTKPRQWSGGIYDEGRRGWLVKLEGQPEKQAAFKNGEWNKYRILAEGDHIQVWVNEIQTTDFHDSEDAEGHVAIQHHGEDGLVYQFRNLRIREIN